MTAPDFQAVLLDFGGTLFAMPPGYGPYVRAARAAGESMTDDRAAHLAERLREGLSDPTVVALEAVRDRSPEAHRTALITRYLLADMSPALADALYAQLVSTETWEPFVDSGPTLRALKDAGLRLVVVSNIGWDLRTQFRAAGFADLIDVFVLSCELGTEKPDPVMFQTAADALGVAPEACLMVGDEAKTDGAASRYGIPTLLLPPYRGGERGLSMVLRCVGLPSQPRGDEHIMQSYRGPEA